MGEAGERESGSAASYCWGNTFLFLLVGESLECGEEGEKDDLI